mmetsp:Transcript_76545/g.139301  ORF Transcript_76545/g.139301 Transcript_76545/m.139301 type:complete len:88 (-) Transcript_76545:48-311(-)
MPVFEKSRATIKALRWKLQRLNVLLTKTTTQRTLLVALLLSSRLWCQSSKLCSFDSCMIASRPEKEMRRTVDNFRSYEYQHAYQCEF